MVLGLDIDARKAVYPGLKPFELKGGVLYGPIPSRRLGFSLGVNILPYDVKVCTWDCLYCQCGWTDRKVDQANVAAGNFPSVKVLAKAFKEGFAQLVTEGRPPESITLSGNGEPTLHPRFEEVVEAMREARDRHLPKAKLSILSNGQRIGDASVRAALDRLDVRCMKLDAGNAETTEKLDRPVVPFSLPDYVENLKLLRAITAQAMFVRGSVDNTGPEAVAGWIRCLQAIRPAEVHLYSLDRVPAAKGLLPVPEADLQAIAERVRKDVGVPARVFAS